MKDFDTQNPMPSVRPDLVIQEVGDELLVYDPIYKNAVNLSGTGKTVVLALKEGCDRDEVLRRLGDCEDSGVVFQETVNQLGGLNLLLNHGGKKFDRRRFIKAAGAAAAVLPVVATVSAPLPAVAQSCSNCPVTAGVPDDCADCNRPCPVTAACNTTSICCFEYVVFCTNGTTPDHAQGVNCTTFQPVDHPTAQDTFRCRVGLNTAGYTVNNTYRVNCQTARDAVLAQAGNHCFERYYCCNCDAQQGAGITYSCNVN